MSSTPTGNLRSLYSLAVWSLTFFTEPSTLRKIAVTKCAQVRFDTSTVT